MFAFQQGGDDEQLVINACAVEGGCGQGASGIFMTGEENVPIADHDVDLPDSINIQATMLDQDELAAQARLARNELADAYPEALRGKTARTFIGAWDRETGQVVAAMSGAEGGGGRCCENNAVIKLGLQNNPGRMQTVEAYGWRWIDKNNKKLSTEYREIATCEKCQEEFEREQFPPGVTMRTPGRWTGGGGGGGGGAGAAEEEPLGP